MKDLKEKTIRGGIARMGAQAANFVLRFGSLMILARLLTPKDFGLVGMVTAFSGVLNLMQDFGLSSAAIQRVNVTEEQISTLFWINILVGGLLGLLLVAMSPVIAVFYHEPRLVRVTCVLALGFFFNAVGVQHGVLLQRHMRFTALALINTISLIVGTSIAVGGAKAGYGYWALVAMTISMPLVSTIGFWVATGWVPGMPKKGVGIRSMIRFGGTVTLNGLVLYFANNLDKILIGRFWGADIIGIYGRAYQLVRIPIDNLNSAVGEVAFSALSRLQDDRHRLKNYFLKGYSIVVAMTSPISIACALFADDVILVFLGPKWKAAIPLFRLMAPTILVFAIANPLSWLVTSLGMVVRNLKMLLVITPLMITCCVMALPYGPKGLAFANSALMVLWVVPVILWSIHGTGISFRDILLALSRPLGSGIVAGGLALALRLTCGQLFSPLPRLVLESILLFGTFFGILFFFRGEKSFYLDLLRGMRGSVPDTEKSAVSA